MAGLNLSRSDKIAYVISGSVCSGNRLLAAILVRAGCWGEASTNRPERIGDIPDEPRVCLIKHGVESCFDDWIRQLQQRFSLKPIILIRDPYATASSMVKRGFEETLDAARRARIANIASNVQLFSGMDMQFEIVTYESLESRGAVVELLRWCGLPTDTMDEPLELIGQNAPSVPVSMNWRHYE